MGDTHQSDGTLSAIDESGSSGRLPAGAVLVLVLECEHPTRPSSRHSLAGVEVVHVGRGDRRSCERTVEDHRRTLRLRVADRRMSSTHAKLSRLAGRWVLEDAGSKNGTLVNGAAITHTVLADGDLVEIGHTFWLFRDPSGLPAGAPADIDAESLAAAAPGLATLLAPLADDIDSLIQVARSDVPIVVLGETGTGKEVVARAVHQLSGRRGAFVAVNCGALPDTLIETELFGYRKGAFSGAAEDRPGLIRSADQGTLFLDEIGDLPGPSQAPLLRVLQEREVTPVGATRPVPVDLRVVAATHRDLPGLVDAGSFRNDLWARLSGFKMVLPPLRERRDDLGLLVSALLRRRVGADADGIGLTPRAARALFFHDWPLNVRELEKCVASALVLSRGAPVGLEHLPEAIQQSAAQPRPAAAAEEAADQPLSEDEQRLRERIIALLKEHKGNIAAVARAMGKARMQIHRWVKRYGIEPDAFRA